MTGLLPTKLFKCFVSQLFHLFLTHSSPHLVQYITSVENSIRYLKIKGIVFICRNLGGIHWKLPKCQTCEQFCESL